MIYLIYLTIILSLGLIALSFSSGSGSVKLPSAMYSGPQETKKKKFILPFAGQLIRSLKIESKIRDLLLASHTNITPAEFFSIKLVLVVGLGLLIYFMEFPPMAVVIGVAIGYIIPDIYLGRKIKARKQAIARMLPETIDLLGLCIEAGLDFTTALKWVIEKARRNPMIDEFGTVLQEIQWGKPRTQALKDMAKRLNIPELSSFVQTIVQAERMGSPVSETFAVLSEDTRLQRFHQGEKIALQAPIKILIPLIFCILPVIAIIIGGPIFLQFMQGGLLSGFGR